MFLNVFRLMFPNGNIFAPRRLERYNVTVREVLKELLLEIYAQANRHSDP